MELVVPGTEHLASYRDALERGFSPRNVESEAARKDELARIDADPAAFLALMDDPQAKGPPIVRPDGTGHARLPGITRWMWDGEFAGSINLRWQEGTSRLPTHVSGHVGFAVPEWKRGCGYAAQALIALLPEARLRGLGYLELTADADNAASRRTIERAGGRAVRSFSDSRHGPDRDTVLYRIALSDERLAAEPGR